MISMSLGWMIGVGVALLMMGAVHPITGVLLIVFGILGLLDHFGGFR